MELILLGLVLAIVVIIMLMAFHYKNVEVSLRKESEAQSKKIESVYDTMWKIIKQKAEVSDKYEKAFREIYPELIAGRYSADDKNMMKWIQEQNPEFNTHLYADLMQAIEIYRVQFQKAQERMADIIREHSTLLESIPSKWFLGGRQPLEYEMISSTRSKTVMQTRLDDNVDVF